MKCASLALIVLSFCLILSGPALSQVSFYQPMTFPDCSAEYPAGYAPLFVNDFNGDGKVDILCAYGLLDLGDGDGTFKSVTPPAGVVLAVADFNGDGKLDLLEEKTNSQTFFVLLGNGDGTFQTAVNTATGGSLGLMAVGDMNGDGYADVLGGYGPVLYVFLSNGDGTFKPGIPANVGAPALSGTISIADVNGDDKLDVVYNALGSSPQPEVTVLLGNGDGILQAPIVSASTPLYFLPLETVVGDFNGDGKPDLFSTASGSGGGLYLLLGNGDGTFQAPTLVLSNTGNFAGNFAAADVNGDGKLDLVFAAGSSTSQTSEPISQIYLGNGDGTFSGPTSYVSSFPAGNSNPPDGTVVIADFNGDGKPDIASSGGILLGNGDGTFQGIPITVLSYNPYAVAIGDFEKNSKPDVAALDSAQSAPYNLYILHNNGDGFLSLLHTYSLSVQSTQVLVGDLNGDGNLDLVVIQAAAPGVGPGGYNVLLGNGDGSFQNPVSYSQSTSFGVASLVDVNNDKKLDLVEGGTNAFVGISLGNGDGTFAATVTYDDLGPWGSTLITGDFNGDGKIDIGVSPPYETSGTVMLYGNGDGMFQAPIIPVNLNSYSATSTADFRNIGRADLFNGSQVALNNGDSTFTFLPSLNYGGILVTDINGDGKIDILVNYTQSGCQTGFELGNGDGTFGPLNNVPASGCYPFTNLVADMNGDGKPDVVFPWGSGVGVLLNTTSAGFSLSASAPSPSPVIAGNSATATVTAIPTFGFNGTETLSCGGLPSGASCTFNPAAITASSKTSTLTITTSSSTAGGTYAVQIVGTAGSVTNSVVTSLVVQGAPDFSIAAASGTPTSKTINPGGTASFTLAFAPSGSFTGTLSLSCAIIPVVTHVPTCGLSSNSVQMTGSGTQTVTVKVGTAAPVASASSPDFSFPMGPELLALSLMFPGLSWLWAGNGKRKLSLGAPMIALAFMFSLGCGGSGSSSHTSAGTPAGTYTATVTATSGGTSHNLALQVVVQ